MLSKKLLISIAVIFVLLNSSLVMTVTSNVIWSKIYQKTGDQRVSSIVQTSDEGFLLAGSIDSDIPLNVFPPDRSDIWLVKTDEFGNMQWNESYEREGLAQAYSLLKTSDGGFLLAGKTLQDYWLVKTDSEGNMEWNNSDFRENDQGWGGYPVIETSDGGFAFASSYYYDWRTSGEDCWLIKTDNQGNVVWNQTYTEAGDQDVAALIETSDRGFVLAGSSDIFDHDGDFWLLITDQDGIPEFPSWIILPLLLVSILVVIRIKNKIKGNC